MKLTGKDGELRIYDSTWHLHAASPYSLGVDMRYYDDSGPSYSNVTGSLESDNDTSVNDCFDTDDYLYIGSPSKFAAIEYAKLDAGDHAAGGGDITITYYDGTDFNTSVANITDNTNNGTNCFEQDGYITFDIPRDWSTGANSFNANLQSSMYYVRIRPTSLPSTLPDIDLMSAMDTKYISIPFIQMDFSGPLGRGLTEELLIMNRGGMDSYAHYIEGSDNQIMDIFEISFSCLIDDTYNNDAIFQALECENPNLGIWTSTGTSTKGDTKNNGSNANPAFVDANKKCVNVQVLWSGSTYSFGMAYYEVFFPKSDQSIAESEDGIILSCRGGVYGVIDKIYGFGNRY